MYCIQFLAEVFKVALQHLLIQILVTLSYNPSTTLDYAYTHRSTDIRHIVGTFINGVIKPVLCLKGVLAWITSILNKNIVSDLFYTYDYRKHFNKQYLATRHEEASIWVPEHSMVLKVKIIGKRCFFSAPLISYNHAYVSKSQKSFSSKIVTSSLLYGNERQSYFFKHFLNFISTRCPMQIRLFPGYIDFGDQRL